MPEEKSQMYELIGRAIADPDFRADLVADPQKAITEAGYELTEEDLAKLGQMDLKGAAEELGERISKVTGFYMTEPTVTFCPPSSS
jgi:hypothetical protein